MVDALVVGAARTASNHRPGQGRNHQGADDDRPDKKLLARGSECVEHVSCVTDLTAYETFKNVVIPPAMML